MSTEQREFIPGRNGGRLLPGGKPGHRGGTGAIPNSIRELCRKGFEEATPQIVAIAKGEPDGTSRTEQVSAYNALGKYGMGELAAVQLEKAEWLNAVAEITAEFMEPAQYDSWWERLMATLDSMK